MFREGQARKDKILGDWGTVSTPEQERGAGCRAQGAKHGGARLTAGVQSQLC